MQHGVTVLMICTLTRDEMQKADSVCFLMIYNALRAAIICQACGLDKKIGKPKLADFLAAGEGFEPSHTESESAVLPLHNPAVFRAEQILLYIFRAICQHLISKISSFFAALHRAKCRAAKRGRKSQFAERRSSASKYFFSGLRSNRINTRQMMTHSTI